MGNIGQNIRCNSLAVSLGMLIVFGGLGMWAPAASAQMGIECGSLQNGYGPFDYSNASHRRERLPIVDRNHFDSGVENLRGHARKPNQLPGDLDYTLRAFPNHHKALYAMLRYSLSEDPQHRRPLRYSADCYFRRALTFQPTDGKVPLLYGIYKSRSGDLNEAKILFGQAESMLPDSAEVQYNIGLVLAKAGEYPDARKHAKRAYELGYPMPGLRNILKRAGQWDEVDP